MVFIISQVFTYLLANNDLDSLLDVVEVKVAEGEFIFDFAATELGQAVLRAETIIELNTFAQNLSQTENKELVVMILPPYPKSPTDERTNGAIFTERAQIVLDKISKDNRMVVIGQMILEINSKKSINLWTLVNPQLFGITRENIVKAEGNWEQELALMLEGLGYIAPSEKTEAGLVILVNGLTQIFGQQIEQLTPLGPKEDYWGVSTQRTIVNYFDSFYTGYLPEYDYPKLYFMNGETDYPLIGTSTSVVSDVFSRYKHGYAGARDEYESFIEIYEKSLEENPDSKIIIVTHSQGAAFGEGMAAYIYQKGNYQVHTIVHLQPSSPATVSSNYFTELNGYPNTQETVERRVGVYTRLDLVANKFGNILEHAHVHVFELGINPTIVPGEPINNVKFNNVKIIYKIEGWA